MPLGTATDLLRKDHRILRRLLAEYGGEGPRPGREKREIYGQLFHELALHGRLEREVLYGALAQRRPADVRNACRRHARIDRILKDLGDLEPDQRSFETGMRALAREVEAHIREEEAETFPAAESVLTARQLEDMAVMVAARRARWNEGEKE
ncbi:MAG TPA: hemerythrin domain-containing protein [Thermoanaerobaculia bacterium]|nr:hemerythrin domain-containing protein [Thermoanaerobaculia bacterium]